MSTNDDPRMIIADPDDIFNKLKEYIIEVAEADGTDGSKIALGDESNNITYSRPNNPNGDKIIETGQTWKESLDEDGHSYIPPKYKPFYVLIKGIAAWLADFAWQGVGGVYHCAASISIGKAVYVYNNDSITLADASAVGTMPAIGIVIAKPSDSRAIVQFVGEVDFGTALFVAGAPYFLANVAGDLAAAPGVIPQRVGTAKSTSVLILDGVSQVTTF